MGTGTLVGLGTSCCYLPQSCFCCFDLHVCGFHEQTVGVALRVLERSPYWSFHRPHRQGLLRMQLAHQHLAFRELMHLVGIPETNHDPFGTVSAARNMSCSCHCSKAFLAFHWNQDHSFADSCLSYAFAAQNCCFHFSSRFQIDLLRFRSCRRARGFCLKYCCSCYDLLGFCQSYLE